MAIEFGGKMNTTQIKTQLEKIATKDEGKCLCQNLTTSFKNVDNPICTVSDMSSESWASAIVLALYSWEYIDGATEPRLRTKNYMLDAFAKCNSHIGETLYLIASILKNNFVIFPLDNLRACYTWDELFSTKAAVDELCSFYPLVSIVEYTHGKRFATAIKTHDSKIVYIRDGYFWNGYGISSRQVCGVFDDDTGQRMSVEHSNGFAVFPADSNFFFRGFNDYEKSVIPVISRFYKTTVSVTILNTHKSGVFSFDTTYNRYGTKYIVSADLWLDFNKDGSFSGLSDAGIKSNGIKVDDDVIRVFDLRVSQTYGWGQKEHNYATGVGVITTYYPISEIYVKLEAEL